PGLLLPVYGHALRRSLRTLLLHYAHSAGHESPQCPGPWTAPATSGPRTFGPPPTLLGAANPTPGAPSGMMDDGMRNFARAVLLGAAMLAAMASLATSARAQGGRPVVVAVGRGGGVDPCTDK